MLFFLYFAIAFLVQKNVEIKLNCTEILVYCLTSIKSLYVRPKRFDLNCLGVVFGLLTCKIVETEIFQCF